MENYKITIPFHIKRSYCSQSECLLTKKHVHGKNSVLKKQNITRKFGGMNIAVIRKALKLEIIYY